MIHVRKGLNNNNKRYIAHLLRTEKTLCHNLREDPESKQYYPNRESRPVWSGHYVRVNPDPISKPELVAYNASTAAQLGMKDKDIVNNTTFLRIMSGDVPENLKPWACGYAVSVLGNEIANPCGYRGMSCSSFCLSVCLSLNIHTHTHTHTNSGQAYGDGRCISVGELERDGERFEIQLKGAGTTPFSRNFDGRAVLRSSVREFLASHAMYHLGVPTTRSLSLIVSKDMNIQRMWYDKVEKEEEEDEDEVRKRKYAPNRIVRERCAIASRVSRSFLRVGSVELFTRRARRSKENREHWIELEMLLEYALRTEFPELKDRNYIRMLEIFAKRQARLVTEWLRVGYVQGNMNSDNALLSGQTLDYGPFAFMERYEKTWTPFTSDPQQNAGFEKQPYAAQLTVLTLCRCVALVCENEIDEIERIVNQVFPDELEANLFEMRCKKLGIQNWNESVASNIWNPLMRLFQSSQIDYTIFWRLLYYSCSNDRREVSFESIRDAFYEEPSSIEDWNEWLSIWSKEIDSESVKKMRTANPKYVPREWMLVKAYEDAETGDYEEIEVLQRLFERPYETQSEEFNSKYFRKTPNEMKDRPGVSFYS